MHVYCIYVLYTCHDHVNKNLFYMITLSLLLQAIAIHIMQEKNQVVAGIPRILSSYMIMTYCMAQNLTVILSLTINCYSKYNFVPYGSKYLHVICIWYAFDILICKNGSFVTKTNHLLGNCKQR